VLDVLVNAQTIQALAFHGKFAELLFIQHGRKSGR
jgi:hypothetical protein